MLQKEFVDSEIQSFHPHPNILNTFARYRRFVKFNFNKNFCGTLYFV